jgi:hypothetical protein
VTAPPESFDHLTQQGQVLDLELGDAVTVAMSPPNINAVGSAASPVLERRRDRASDRH